MNQPSSRFPALNKLIWVGSLLISALGFCLSTKPMPVGVQAVLDIKYPGWKLIQVSPLFEESRRKILAVAEEQIKKGEARPEDFDGYDRLKQDSLQPSNMIFGDFDGDGAEDCAVAIKQARGSKLTFLALFPRGDRYEEQVLDSIPVTPDFTIMLIQKGEPMADEERGPEVDYIRVDAPDASGYWFVFREGTFQRIELQEGIPTPRPLPPAAEVQAAT